MKHTSNPVEMAFEQVLIAFDIRYTCPDQEKGVRRERHQTALDFYLPDFNVSVEVKSASCERMHAQIRNSGKEDEGVIVLVGLGAVQAFCNLLAYARAKKEQAA